MVFVYGHGILLIYILINPYVRAFDERYFVPKTVVPGIRGRVNQTVTDHPTLEITVWHQHPAQLKNCVFKATISGPMVFGHEGLATQIHSFVVWDPNQDHGVTLRFPLRHYDPDQEIPIELSLHGNGIKTWTHKDTWLANEWNSNRQSANNQRGG